MVALMVLLRMGVVIRRWMYVQAVERRISCRIRGACYNQSPYSQIVLLISALVVDISKTLRRRRDYHAMLAQGCAVAVPFLFRV